MICRICGTNFNDGRFTSKRLFCSPACAHIYHNVRKVRGDQVYDLLMTRASSYRQRGLISEIDRMVKVWLADDKAQGRKTYRDRS